MLVPINSPTAKSRPWTKTLTLRRFSSVGKMRLVDNRSEEDDGQWTIWTMDNMDNGQYGQWTIWTVDNMDNGQYGQWTIWTMDNMDNGQYGQ
nr:hypothetical protein BgiMline_031798 [Biomphalaria glabrata]